MMLCLWQLAQSQAPMELSKTSSKQLWTHYETAGATDKPSAPAFRVCIHSNTALMPSLFAVLDEGGRTVLVKTQGDVQTPSFPTLGLLCTICTFASSKGFAVNSYSSSNVQIVYQGFPSHLLLVLATSNMLVPRERLKALLQAAYQGLSMCVGKDLLEGQGCNSLDALKLKLRGISWLDHLVNHDALFPSLMLPGPQWFGMSADDQQQLQLTLNKLGSAVSSFTTALLREGLYVAASKQWQQQLPATQQQLIQHLAMYSTHVQGELSEMQVCARGASGAEETHRLLMICVAAGVILLLLLPEQHVDISADAITSAVQKLIPAVEPILQVDLCCSSLPPQLAACSCDLLAAVTTTSTQQTPARASVRNTHVTAEPVNGTAQVGRTAEAPTPDTRLTLYWCHNRTGNTSHSFNPLASPSLRKQLSSPRSAPSASFRSLSISTNVSGADETSPLYFKTCCDMLAAFMITSSPAPWTAQPEAVQLDMPTDVLSSPDQELSAFKRLGSPPWKDTSCHKSGDGSVEASPRQRAADDLRITTSVVPSDYAGSPAASKVPASSARSGPSLSKRLLSFISGMTPKKERVKAGNLTVQPATLDAHQQQPATFVQPCAMVNKPVLQETQVLTEGKRLVAVMELTPGQQPNTQTSLSVFVCSSRAWDRQGASQSAHQIRQALQTVL